MPGNVSGVAICRGNHETVRSNELPSPHLFMTRHNPLIESPCSPGWTLALKSA